MNNHFCPNPFVYVTNSLEGIVKYCCLVQRGIEDDNGNVFKSDGANLQEVWNSKDLNNVRQQMIEGKAVKDCEVCYNLERIGGGSLRTDLLSHWMNGPRKEQFDNALAEYYSGQGMSGPVSMEIRTGNLCNLKCRMCYPTASVLIEKEFNKLRKQDSEWNKISDDIGSSMLSHDGYFQEVVNNFHRMDALRFSGGEPFLTDITLKIIHEAASTGHSSHIDLFVNTNFTRITTELLEDLKTFRTVNIDISLDGYKQVHEYVRSGLEWSSIEENLEKIRPYLTQNFFLSTNTTVQNLNVLYLEDVLKWTIDELNITPVLCVLDNPKFLAIRNMPTEMKIEASKRIRNLIDSDLVNNYKTSHWLKGRLTSILESIELPADTEEFNRFLYFTNVTDKARGQNYRESIPEVASYYEQYYPVREVR
jgi:MoaA/NifB/PqqE/SkfB family radical SAM enzyme